MRGRKTAGDVEILKGNKARKTLTICRGTREGIATTRGAEERLDKEGPGVMNDLI